jgi:hypothetical protein
VSLSDQCDRLWPPGCLLPRIDSKYAAALMAWRPDPDDKGAWSAVGIALMTAGTSGAIAWLAITDPASSHEPLWPVFALAALAVIGIYGMLAPLVHLWPWRRDGTGPAPAVATDGSASAVAQHRPERVVPKHAGHRDVFISHASEDKAAIARPLKDELEKRGHTVWFDESELVLGDNLGHQIDQGLAQSAIGVVILSHAFFSKRWPKRELDGLIVRLRSGENNVIVPIWHGLTELDLLRYSPPLADLLAGDSAEGVATLADRIARVLARRATLTHPHRVRRSMVHIGLTGGGLRTFLAHARNATTAARYARGAFRWVRVVGLWPLAAALAVGGVLLVLLHPGVKHDSAAVGPVTVRWTAPVRRTHRALVIPGLRLANAISLQTGRPGTGRMAIVGDIVGPTPGSTDPLNLATSPGAQAGPTRVAKVGTLELLHRALTESRLQLDVYALATSAGWVVFGCSSPSAASTLAADDCAHLLLQTSFVDRSHVEPVAPDRRYARYLEARLTELTSAHRSVGDTTTRQLTTRTKSFAFLAAAYAASARILLALAPPLRAQEGTTGVAHALADLAGAYRQLARAASEHDPRTYAMATIQAGRAESRLHAGIATLRRAGYVIGEANSL